VSSSTLRFIPGIATTRQLASEVRRRTADFEMNGGGGGKIPKRNKRTIAEGQYVLIQRGEQTRILQFSSQQLVSLFHPSYISISCKFKNIQMYAHVKFSMIIILI